MAQSIAQSKRKRSNNNRTPAQREEAKQKFLLEYSRTKSIIHSCAYANISQSAYYQWLQSGFITQDDMAIALEGYHDNIRKKVSELALEGAKRQVRDSHGNPLFEPDGSPTFEYVVSEKIFLGSMNTCQKTATST